MREVEKGTATVTAVVIGVSAGGPRALQRLLPGFSRGFPAPVLVVQHFVPELFGGLLRTLSQHSDLPIDSAVHEGVLECGHVFLCPPDNQCRVLRRAGRLVSQLTPDTASTYRPCIDETMSSVATACGSGAIGVLLTGMGSDGVRGLRAIVEAGGLSIVESEQTAAVFGMPKEAQSAGVAQRVLPLHQIPTELIMELRRRVQAGSGRDAVEEQLRRVHVGSIPRTSSIAGSGLRKASAVEVRPVPSDSVDPAVSDEITDLVGRLQSGEPIIVESAKRRLIALSGRFVLPELLPLLSSEVPLVRATVVEIAKRVELGSVGTALIRRLCQDTDPDLRLFAVDIIEAHPSPDLLDVALRCCEDETTNVALAALGTLGSYSDACAVERLAKALDGEAPQRAAALMALGRSPASEATVHLVTLINNFHFRRPVIIKKTIFQRIIIIISGEFAFHVFDTHGIPVELLPEMFAVCVDKTLG